jgi:hypothetical protein
MTFTNRMTAETLRVRADIAVCSTHAYVPYDRAEVVLTLLDQSDFKDAVESQIRKANKRISNVSSRNQL